MARPIEVPVVVKKDSLRRSIEGEATAAMRKLGGSSTAVQPLGRMLGKIRADADEFTKSIEASNARVIAFGASVGVINGISNAFKSLVATTIKVEKSMADINIVLGASEKSLAKFGDGLFKVAKNTAQSFDVVTEAATEFARQGLSIEETLKRTNDALILTRLTGLKAADSVKGLTAAVNGFGKAGLTTTQIINKLSAVDVKFAVGTDDLINALGRAGAVAQDAGVNFDELVALVTVAQQKTARGGAVIGNAFKTIYTRMQDPRALQALRQVGVAVDDVRGAALPANRVLQNLAQTYDSLNRSQKATLDQFVAGKFQINILKSVLGDLNTVNGEYARAQQVSINATDQAIQKNDTLNKTMAALATQSGLALDELAKKVGDLSFGPGMKNILQSFNALVEGATSGLDGEGTGSTFAKGLLRGIGGVLTGPGLFIIGGVFIKLFKDLTVFGVKSLKNLLGLNNASKQQAALQQGIGQLLATNVKYQTAMVAAEGNIAKQAAITQRFLASEVVLRERAAAASAKLAASAYAGGFGVSAAGVLTRGRSRGRAPSFAPTGGGASTGDGGVPNFMMLSHVIRGMKRKGASKISQEASGRINNLEGSAREEVIMRSLGLKGGLGSSIPLLSLKGKGRIEAGPDISEAMMRRSGVIAGDVKPGLIKSKGSSDVFGHKSTNKKTGKKTYGIGQFTRASAQGGVTYSGYERFTPEQLAIAGKSSSGAYGYSFPGGKAGQVARGINPFKGGWGDPSSSLMGPQLPAAARKQSQKFRDIEAATARVRESGLPGRGEFRAMPANFSDSNLRRAFYTRVGRSMSPKVVPKFTRKGNDWDASDKEMNAILEHLEGQPYSFMQRHMTTAANTERRLSNRRGSIPSFSPISDAISREKTQVGSMMGISPSSVQTRVVQNSSLQSPFNPQGFGVISPTVGQNSFADAARMHKGEDLRTTNLPNFAKGRRGTGTSGGVDPLMSVTDYLSKIQVDATIKDYSEKATKKMEKAYSDPMLDRVRLERGTRLKGMSVDAGVERPLSRWERTKAGAGRFVSGMKGAGGRMMGPAFTGMMVGEMAAGFTPAATSSQRVRMTPQQRIEADRGNKGLSYAGYGSVIGAGVGSLFGGIGAGPGAVIGAGVGGAYGWFQGGDPGLTAAEREGVVGDFVSQRNADMGAVDAVRSAMAGMNSLRGDSAGYNRQLTKIDSVIKDIKDPKLKADVTKAYTSIKESGTFEAGVSKISDIGAEASQRMGGRLSRLRGGAALTQLMELSSKGDLSEEQRQDIASRFSALPRDEMFKMRAFSRIYGGNEGKGSYVQGTGWGAADDLKEVTGFESLGLTPQGLASNIVKNLGEGEGPDVAAFGGNFTKQKRFGAEFEKIRKFMNLSVEEGGLGYDETGQGGKTKRKLPQGGTWEEVMEAMGITPDSNAYPEFLDMRRRLVDEQTKYNRQEVVRGGQRRVRGVKDQARLGIMERVGGARSTIMERYGIAENEAQIQAQSARQKLAADFGGQLSKLDIPTTVGPNKELFESLTNALTSGDTRGAQATLKQVNFEKGTYDGKQLNIADTLKLESFAKQLENASDIVEGNIKAQEDYNVAMRDTAKMLDKNGVLIAGIEGFRNSLQDAFTSIADPSLSGGDIARNFAMGILGSIQQQASSNVADFISGSLFGDLFKKKDNQSGGIIGAQNGMYISGSGTGDKYPALLENKEYVLNRNAVEALGGPAALDAINFGIAPRFAYGGVFGGVRSKARNRAVEKFGWASMGPTSGGSALGGGGMSLGLDYFDSRLSSLAYNDPTAQAIKGYFREDHQKQIAKKFQKQANEDALKQAVVGAAVSAGLSYGVGKIATMSNTPPHEGMSYVEARALNAFDPNLGAMPAPGTGGAGIGGGGTGGGTTFTNSVVQPAIPFSFPGDPRLGGGPSRSIFSTVWDKVKTKGSAILEEIGGQRLSGLGSGIGAALGNTAGDKDKINAARVAAGNAAATAEIARTQAKQAQDIVKQKEYTERDLEQRSAYMAAASNLEKVNEQGKPAMAFRKALNPLTGGYTSGTTSHLGEHAPAGSHPSASLLQQFREATGVKKNKRGRYEKHTRKQFADYLYELSEKFGGGRPAPPPPKTTIGAPDGFLGSRRGQRISAPLRLGPNPTIHEGQGQIGPIEVIRQQFPDPEFPGTTAQQTSDGKWWRVFPDGRKDSREAPKGYQRGGAIDNIPAMLTGGEFVMNAGAVRKYGSATLGNMNRFQTGGIVGPQKFVPGEEGGSGGGKQKPAESSTNNNTVNISVNMGNGGGGANVTEDAVGTNLNTANGGRELGAKIKKAVLHVIEEEKRVGGRLRNPYAKDQ